MAEEKKPNAPVSDVASKADADVSLKAQVEVLKNQVAEIRQALGLDLEKKSLFSNPVEGPGKLVVFDPKTGEMNESEREIKKEEDAK